jgi:hypothetical protein
MTVFEYQNQAFFNVTIFDGGPRFVMLTLAFGIQGNTVVFGILKASRF